MRNVLSGVQEEPGKGRIKIRSAAFFDDGKALLQGHGVPVAPLLGYGIKYIGNGHDPGVEGNLLPAEPIRVALAVVLFVVVSAGRTYKGR